MNDNANDCFEQKDDDFEELDLFLDYLNYLRNEGLYENKKPNYNMKRLAEMINAFSALQKLVLSYSQSASVICSFDLLEFGTATIRVIVDELAIYDIGLFIQAIKNAENFEIYPRMDGNVAINFIYRVT